MSALHCPYCGQKLLNETTTMCTNCGRDLNPVPPKPSEKPLSSAVQKPASKSPAESGSAITSSDQTRSEGESKLSSSMKQMGGDISSLRSEVSEIRMAQDSLNESLKKILEKLEAIEGRL